MGTAPQRSADAATAGGRRGRLAELQGRARGCERCPALAANRTTVVFGSGDPDADLMLIGEAPGQNEDRQGLPLVGAPGRLLLELLAEIGVHRDDVYIANVLKCRPPDNRDPLAEEIANCRPYLEAQVELVRPRLICSLGNFATKVLRQDPAGIKQVHGRVEVRTVGRRTVRLLPVLHPSAALYLRANLDHLRHDLAAVPALLELPVPTQPDPPREPQAGPPLDPAGGPAAADRPRPAADADDGPPAPQLELF